MSQSGFLVTSIDKTVRQKSRIRTCLDIGNELHANQENKRLSFLTLTSSPDSPREIAKSWPILFKRIKRHYPYHNFSYSRIKTQEGYGVIHMIIDSPYIPFKWLQNQWKQIHKAHNCNIQEIKNYNKTRKYMLSYLQNQPGKIRSSSSYNWIYLGWRKVYKLYRSNIYHNKIFEARQRLTIPLICKMSAYAQIVLDYRENLIYQTLMHDPPFRASEKQTCQQLIYPA